jgi:hypothetical protein
MKRIKIEDKYLGRKTIKNLIQLHGLKGAVLAIADTYGLDEIEIQLSLQLPQRRIRLLKEE